MVIIFPILCSFLSLGQLKEAAKALFRRSDVKTLELCAEIANKCEDKDLVDAVLFRLNAFKLHEDKNESFSSTQVDQNTTTPHNTADVENLDSQYIGIEQIKLEEDNTTITTVCENGKIAEKELKNGYVLSDLKNINFSVEEIKNDISDTENVIPVDGDIK